MDRESLQDDHFFKEVYSGTARVAQITYERYNRECSSSGMDTRTRPRSAKSSHVRRHD